MNCNTSLEKTDMPEWDSETLTLRCYLGQGLREGDANTSFLHLLLKGFDAILAVIIIGRYGAHPSPAEV